MFTTCGLCACTCSQLVPNVALVKALPIDAAFVVAVTAAAILGMGTLKVLALAHHENPIAQGYLTLF